MNKLISITTFISMLIFITATSIGVAFFEYQKKEKAEIITLRTQQAIDQSAKMAERYIAVTNRIDIVNIDRKNQVRARYGNGTAISNGLVDTVTTALNIARSQILHVKQMAIILQMKKIKAQNSNDSLQRLVNYYQDKYMTSNTFAGTGTREDPKYGILDFRQ